MSTDEAMMARALTLAELGWGKVYPNPLVGAVVVRDGEIVGEGWHAEFGGQHAEAVALAVAGDAARGATLFVSLEPCTHHGKQPPCVDAVRAAGVARVVVAIPDPNPAAQGGIAQLRAAGITVEVGLLGNEAARLNARFLHRFAGVSRPWVAIKLAVSMDGRIADAKRRSQWISGETARRWTHWLRAGFGAVAVGAVTAVADDVRLTVRGSVVPRLQPTRVVFDRHGILSADHGIFKDTQSVPVIMVLGSQAASREAELRAAGAQVLFGDTIEAALVALADAGIDSLLVEGGGELAGSLLRSGLVDRIYQIQAPIWLGEDGVPAWGHSGPIELVNAPRWRTVARQALGDDTLLVLEP